ncbi:hypothetical protein AAEO57_02200 [Flavobacterium sp. DGU38]|uniref:Lipoprotein n=1 Tax=Flavobacterium calami TaxID=3139144 RepID=A0ABU9IJF8_9FLAO
MKKLKLIFTSILLVFIAVSCDNDGGTSKIDTIEGAVPNIQKIAGTDQGLNLLALKNGEDIDLGLTFDTGFGKFSSLDVVGFYTKNGVTERAVLKANVSGFPATIHFNQNDLYNAFNSINSANDITTSDVLKISADLKQKDGTILKMYDEKGVALFGSDIANTTLFSVFQNYIVSCPLEDASLFNGNYKVTADTWQDYSVGDIVPVVYNPSNGQYVFRILNTANPYLINASTSYIIGTINPVNNSVTVTSNEQWNYGPGQVYTVTGTGNVGSCTGDINLKIRFSGSAEYTFNLVKAN